MSTIETISMIVPAELQAGSVVLDKDGDAWQRTGPLWFPAHTDPKPRDWVDLLATYGPLTVIYYATEDEL